jgi:hypothetical protein
MSLQQKLAGAPSRGWIKPALHWKHGHSMQKDAAIFAHAP